MQRPYALSCHCGEIRIEVDAELVDLVECNCSTCRRSGFLHWKVKLSAVRLLTEKRKVATYMWRAIGGHHFCPTCGTGMFRMPYPDEIVSINARCLEGVDVFALPTRRFDGRNIIPPGPLP